jgi:DNA-binding CsgD family transcriptional regulator
MRRVANLSRREHQVLNAITAGKSSKAMAHELGISVRTIEVHRARMLQRLGVPNIAKAIRLAIMAELGTTDVKILGGRRTTKPLLKPSTTSALGPQFSCADASPYFIKAPSS